jgi:hypothetical protein
MAEKKFSEQSNMRQNNTANNCLQVLALPKQKRD